MSLVTNGGPGHGTWEVRGFLAPQGRNDFAGLAGDLMPLGGNMLISSPTLQGQSGLILAAFMPLDGPHIFPL